jgi:hypothetical protein
MDFAVQKLFLMLETLSYIIEWLQINYLFLFVGKFESLWSTWVPEIIVPQSKFQILTHEVALHPLLYSSLIPDNFICEWESDGG